MDTAILVGYGRRDISPKESVPLAGYGNTMSRLSLDVLDSLYATCVAITDDAGSTMVLCTVDLVDTNDFYFPQARDQICRAYGIKPENLLISATHTHSAPDMTQSEYPPIVRYTRQLVETLTAVVGDALADRKPAKAFGGKTCSKAINHVRHNILENGASAGPNHGNFVYSPIKQHATEADRQLQLVKFCREEGRDILLINWQAHPLTASSSVMPEGRSNHKYVSADYVGSCRSFVEEQTGLLVAYFQGACGNIGPDSKVHTENNLRNHTEYGRCLGESVLSGLETLQPLQMGQVAAQEGVCTSPVNHTEIHLLPKAKEIMALWRQTNDLNRCVDEGEPYGIYSPYHAVRLVEKCALEGELTLPVRAGCVGEFGFAALPYEVFDTNGRFIKENSPFAMTFIVECANGSNSYIPSRYAFEYGCYESDSCKYMPGTGEKAADLAVELLRNLKKEMT